MSRTDKEQPAVGTEGRAVVLGPWQEIEGVVLDAQVAGESIRVLLSDDHGLFPLTVPADVRGRDRLVVGARVAILRTDRSPAGYAVRTIGNPVRNGA